jgi:hypothetical protein
MGEPYVGFLSYQDANTCGNLTSFVSYPPTACLEMMNTHPDKSTFVSGHTKFSCGASGATVMSYLPTDTTCSEKPYDVYLLPDYNQCPNDPELPMYTCLAARNVTALLSTRIRGVVSK